MSRKRNLAQEQEQPLEPHQPSGTTPSPVHEDRGDRVFEKVAEMLHEEKGIAAGQLQDEGIGF